MTKKENTVLYVLKLGAILFIICAVVAAALAGVNAITKDKIAAINAQKVADAISLVLESSAEPEIIEDANAPSEISAIYKMGDDGYAVQVVVSGSQGSIDMMVGTDPEGTVTGISIVKHSETAGLGAVYADGTDAGVAFRESFVGKSGEIAVTDVAYKSGATISAEAICNGAEIASAYVAGLG